MWVLQTSPGQHQVVDLCLFPSCVLYRLSELLGTISQSLLLLFL